MSIINCKHCNQNVDTDFNSEHEEECEYKEVDPIIAGVDSSESLELLNKLSIYGM